MTKIYLVDDEPVPIRVLKMTLERSGHEVESFSNGALALDRIREAQPDVLISDIEMPVMTGEELCKQINAEFPGRSFPIFVVTSLTDLAHRDWARKIDNLHFLEKPVSMRRLSSQMNTVLAAGGM
jgi:CheY-like chemotaxis protein